MEPIYVGDFLLSTTSYDKIIEKYDKGIKEGKFLLRTYLRRL